MLRANCPLPRPSARKAWTGLSGVNVTVGLPILRVSVDHGTAFDRAGKGTANPESMIEAILIASEMASRETAPTPPSPRQRPKAV